MTFGFAHLKWNKFETSYSIVKSHLIGHHLSYDNQSKYILNVFDLVWWEIVLKWIWERFVEKFECISILNSKVFMKISICYISYLQSWLKMFDPWNYINVSYWAMSSSPFVDNRLGNLNSGEEWSLWGKFCFIRTFI